MWLKVALPRSAELSWARRDARRRETLLDFLDDVYASPKEFLVFDDGYRIWSHTYDQVRGAAYTFGERLRRERIGKGDKIILWGENRPEWIVAFWGALSEGVIVVPVDYRSSADLVRRIQAVVQPRAVLIGDDISRPAGASDQGGTLDAAGDVPVWRLAGMDWTPSNAHRDRVAIGPGDTAEIIFTSGATAEPKGVVITHRNVLANIVPIEREVAKYRPLAWPFSPVRFLDLLPLSHMFGQAMAAFIPPMLTGVVVLMRGYNPREIVRQLKTRRISVLVCVPKLLDVLREYVIQHVPGTRAALERETARVSIPRRLWRYRHVHRQLGWKFWSFVVGAAPLESELELGLSSLERIELMTTLEEQFDTTIDEGEFSSARTVGDLESLVQRGTAAIARTDKATRATGAPPSRVDIPPRHAEPMTFPSWNRRLWARAVRRINLPVWILPLARGFAWVQVHGLEHLRRVDGPVIFASNHLSHLDTPAILIALPPRWRYRVAPAMAKDFFDAHFHPERHPWRKVLTLRAAYYLAALVFNAFPIPRREAGARETLRYMGELVSDGFSILIFPEGEISHRGDVLPFQPGVGMLASRLNMPVVPVRLQGLDRVLHPTWRMARPGRATVTFGAPLRLPGQDYAKLAKQVEEAVRGL